MVSAAHCGLPPAFCPALHAGHQADAKGSTRVRSRVRLPVRPAGYFYFLDLS
jgi:hypothetical protein